MMRKVVVSGLLFAFAASAYAGGYIPAGTSLSVQLTHLDAHTLRAEVVRPPEVKDAWEKIAAGLVGCTVSGSRMSRLPAPDEGKLNTLDCPGHASLKINGLAVSNADARAVLDVRKPGDNFTVVLMDGVSIN